MTASRVLIYDHSCINNCNVVMTKRCLKVETERWKCLAEAYIAVMNLLHISGGNSVGVSLRYITYTIKSCRIYLYTPIPEVFGWIDKTCGLARYLSIHRSSRWFLHRM